MPLFGGVFSRAEGHDVELGKRGRESITQLGLEDDGSSSWNFIWSGNVNAKGAQAAPPQAHRDGPTPTDARIYPLLPSSSTSAPCLQSEPSRNDPKLHSTIPQLMTLPERSHASTDRLAVPACVTGKSRSRSNSRSSRQSSRRNTLVTSNQVAEDHQTAMNKVRVVGIEDPIKTETIAAQALTIEHLRSELLKHEHLRSSLQDQLRAIEERAKKAEQKYSEAERATTEAEQRTTEAERIAVVSQTNALEAGKLAEVAKTRVADTERALEVEKDWADQRVKMVEQTLQQDFEHRLAEAKKQARNLSCRELSMNLSTGVDVHMEPLDARKSEVEASCVVARVEKGKNRQLDPPLNQGAQVQSLIPKPVDFTRPRAGGKKLRIVPPVPPRLNSEPINDDEDTLHPDTFHQSFLNMGLNQKLEAVLEGHKKMSEMLDILCTKGLPQTPAYRPQRKADPDFKMPAARSPRNAGRNAALKFVRCHLYGLMGISRAEDMLIHKDQIYTPNTPLRLAMAAYEERGIGTKPSLEPTMYVNWDEFDGKWNSELCSQFIDHLVSNEGYGDGHPTEEEEQIAINIFWEQLDRLREIVKRNKPKDGETEDQTSDRITERKKEDRAKASMNSRRKNTYHDRIDTCLLHIQSGGLSDDERRAWKNHFAAIQELGMEGMSSDEPDDDDPLTFNIRTLPWRARTLTKICIQTDLARNTTNAYGNRRAGNLPRTCKRKDTARTSSRKAPAGKPSNFYDSQWYSKLGRDRQKRLAPKGPMEIVDTEFEV